jgi:hypothetical protein
MTEEQFRKFRHEAVHALMRLNEDCENKFRISSWPRWDYDLERGTLTFSQDDVPKVVASIHLVGTSSNTSGTWLWGWGNGSLPAAATEALKAVRAFGEEEGVVQLTSARVPDDEYLGWGMTAIAAQILGSKGGYRCPGSDGFIYVVYTELRFAADEPCVDSGKKQVECKIHGSGSQAFVCEHLLSNPAQEWFSEAPSQTNQWPDAWCSVCDAFFQDEGEWNANNESNLKIKLICHQCYEKFRSKEK